MGLFKQMKELKTTAEQLGADTRPKGIRAGLAQAQEAMASATATMEAIQSRAQLLMNGEPGTATLVNARQTGQFVNYAPMIEATLHVETPGRAPMTVTVQEPVEQLHLARLVPGAVLPVRVGEGTEVAIDWMRPA